MECRALLDRFPPRVRALVALLLGVASYPLLPWLGALWARTLMREEPGSFQIIYLWVALVILARACLILLLLRWIRGGDGWRRTLGMWVGRGRATGLLFGVGLALPILLGSVLIGGWGVLSLPPAWVLPAIVSAVLIAPVVEEVVYRGFLFGILYREFRLHPGVALALSSLVFGLVHVSSGGPFSVEGGARVLTAGGLGAALGWSYWRRGEDLWFPIGAHAAVNLAVSFLAAPEGAEGVEFRAAKRGLAILLVVLGAELLRALEARRGRPLPDARVGGTTDCSGH